MDADRFRLVLAGCAVIATLTFAASVEGVLPALIALAILSAVLWGAWRLGRYLLGML